jgi:NAD(P)-dependent dehydrogenase (short-subunit alcohol dehydrogenase family)
MVPKSIGSLIAQLGFAFVQALVQRDNVIVFAGARDPFRADELKALVQEHPGKLHIVKLVSADEAGNKAAVEEIKEKAGRLDVVIANAGKPLAD